MKLNEIEDEKKKNEIIDEIGRNWRRNLVEGFGEKRGLEKKKGGMWNEKIGDDRMKRKKRKDGEGIED